MPSLRRDPECLVFSPQACRTAHAVPWPRSAVIPPPSRGCQQWSSRCSVILPGPLLREFLLSRTNMFPFNKSPLHAQKNSYYSSHEWTRTGWPAPCSQSPPLFERDIAVILACIENLSAQPFRDQFPQTTD